jgi:hypothetical protein
VLFFDNAKEHRGGAVSNCRGCAMAVKQPECIDYTARGCRVIAEAFHGHSILVFGDILQVGPRLRLALGPGVDCIGLRCPPAASGFAFDVLVSFVTARVWIADEPIVSACFFGVVQVYCPVHDWSFHISGAACGRLLRSSKQASKQETKQASKQAITPPHPRTTYFTFR